MKENLAILPFVLHGFWAINSCLFSTGSLGQDELYFSCSWLKLKVEEKEGPRLVLLCFLLVLGSKGKGKILVLFLSISRPP